MHIYHYQAGPALHHQDHKIFIWFGCIWPYFSKSFFVPWSPLFCFVFLSFICLWFENKVIQKSCEDVYTHTPDFVSLFQFVCLCLQLLCMWDWQPVPWHYNCTFLCPPFGICGQPPWVDLCPPVGQKNSRSDVHVRTSLTSFNYFMLWPTHWMTLWRRSPLNCMIISVWIYWHNWTWVTVSDFFFGLCVSDCIFNIAWVFASSTKFPFENSLTLQMKWFHSLKLIFSLLSFKFTKLLKFPVLSSTVLEVRVPAAQSVRPSM